MSFRITSIGIPTRDRTESLRSSVLSYAEATRSERSAPAFRILDNSPSSSVQAANGELLSAISGEYNLAIQHLDYEKRDIISQHLAHYSGIQESTLRFALFGDQRCAHSYGACRNTLLLLASGDISLQVDDDTRCRVARSKDRKTGLAIVSRQTPENYRPIAHKEHMAAGEAKHINLSTIHTPHLGRPLLDVLGQALTSGFSPDTRAANKELLNLLSHPEATIATTYLGTVGDSGMQGHASRLFEPHKQLLASEDDFNQLMTTRWMIKSVPQTTISNSPHCMTIHIGLDTRKLLPPFMPVMRNEDGVFGAVKHVCFPHYLSAYLPYTIQHLPPEERPAPSLDDALRSPVMRTNDLVCQLVLYAKPDLGHAPSLKSLGEYLLEIASSSPDSFRQLVQDKAHQTRQNIIAFALQQLDAFPEGPEFWVRGVRAYINSLKKPAEAFAPADLNGPFKDRWVIFQDLVHQYATLLIHWATIYEAGRLLRSNKSLGFI